MNADATPIIQVTPANPLPIQTIAAPNGEIYTQGDKIIGRKVVEGNTTKYYRGDKLHRDDDLPAVIRVNGGGSSEIYHKNGDMYRVVNKNSTGVAIMETYYNGDKFHREGDKPACINRSHVGVVTKESYYIDGVLSREGDAPARIKRALDGEIIKEEYAATNLL